MPKPNLHVTIMSPERTLYEGEAKSVSSVNNVGRFDILAHHANFISLIREHITVHTSRGQTQKFDILSAVIHVKANRVRAFVVFA